MKNNCWLLAPLLFGLLNEPALADDTSESEKVELSSSKDTPIVVTARRINEPAISAPVSVTYFNSDQIEKSQSDSLEPLARAAPNVSYESGANIAGGGRAYTAFVRGIGQNDFLLTIDPGVGLYVDGVYVSRTVAGTLDTHDIQSVQILRGPQGTFFGKNTIGGAIVVESKKPNDQLEAGAKLTFGRFERGEIAGLINLPISDEISFRGELLAQREDGYVMRFSDGEFMGGTRSINGKISVSAELSPAVRMLLRLDGIRARDQGVPSTMLAATNQIIVADPSAPPNFGFFYNLTQTGGTCGIPPLPPVPQTNACFGPHFITDDRTRTWAGGENFSDIDQWGASLTLDIELGPTSLRSITAYRDVDSAFYLDTDSSPLTISETQNDYSYSQFSQELSAFGKIGSNAEWIAGLYYLSEQGLDENELRFSIADFSSGGRTENLSLAAFAHVNLKLSSWLSLSAGARYSHERKAFTPDQFIRLDRTGGSLIGLSQFLIPPELNPDGRRILPPIRSVQKTDQFTPTVSLAISPSDNANIYFSYAEGFKAGGFTQRVFPPEAQTPDFGPEKVRNYEVGAKFDLPRVGGFLNLSAFYADYSQMQLIINSGLAPKVENAGKAKIYGIEAEIAFEPMKWLRIGSSIGLINSSYQEVSQAAFPVTVDSRLPNAPDVTLSVATDASIVERSKFNLDFHVNWSYKSSHFKDANNSINLFQKGYGLLNANISGTFPEHSIKLTLGVSNITNENYLVSGYSELAIQAAAYGVFGRPRSYFVRLGADF